MYYPFANTPDLYTLKKKWVGVGDSDTFFFRLKKFGSIIQIWSRGIFIHHQPLQARKQQQQQKQNKKILIQKGVAVAPNAPLRTGLKKCNQSFVF